MKNFNTFGIRRTLRQVRQPSCATVALIGNPNTGKSSLFGKLVGKPQRVGNYPGVTVEKTVGRFQQDRQCFDVIDLPGLYSLSPHSRDEMVAVDLLLGRFLDTPPVDIVVCVVDATNLERSFYLLSQVLELGLPTIVALNKLDIARNSGALRATFPKDDLQHNFPITSNATKEPSAGVFAASESIKFDIDALASRLGVSVVCTQADRGLGVDELKRAIAGSLAHPATPPKDLFPEAFKAEVDKLEEYLAGHVPRWLAERLLLDTSGYLEKAILCDKYRAAVDIKRDRQDLHALLIEARERLRETGCAVPGVETESRYAWAQAVLEGVLSRPSHYQTTVTDRIDRVLTHRLWGTLIFVFVMVAVFQAVFSGAVPFMDLVEHSTSGISQWIETHMAAGALRSLLADGVVGGVGAVLSFLPQILILFLFIALLEDCGYMSRAAFLMDRMMSRVGLSGRSFIPMLSSFACAVPGIMATRVIPNDRDRLTTILVAPLMTCSARLPIYTLMIAAFIPGGREYSLLGGWINLQGLVLTALYTLGIIAAITAALVFKKTILRGQTSDFLLELPDYKWPAASIVCHRVIERGWDFVRFAGTMVLLVSILIWAAAYYPHDKQKVEGPYTARKNAIESQLAQLASGSNEAQRLREEQADLERQIQAAYQHQSILGRLGRMIEPVVKPLGWDWRIGCAVLASFSAREVVVATLGVIYNLGDDFDVESPRDRSMLTTKLREARWDGSGQKVFNIPVALSIMVFYALCAQCAATLVVIKTETGKWRWPVFTFCYMTALAYLAALATYQVGILFAAA